MSWKAYFKGNLLLLSVTVTWLMLIALMSPLQIPLTLLGRSRGTRIGRYTYGLWIAQDQLVNAIHAGNPDITVSSKVGYMAEQGSSTAQRMEVVIDWLFYKAVKQENHCRVSVEKDEEHYDFK
tara:strand:- start:326 stop:694 length:369 start_codon:yes stop_codon:yes gene_type:complete